MNRWIRLGAAVTAMIMIANLQYGWTLFTGPLTKATGWKLSEVQWGWTLFIALETWAMSLCGWMIDKRGPRVLMTIAGVLCGVGWAGLGQAPRSPRCTRPTRSPGLGAAMVYCGCIGVALKWFPDKRGLAAGVIAAGFGAGASLFIPVMSYIIRVQDYRAAFLYTGIVQGLLIIVAAQVVGGAGVPPAVTATVAKPKARSHGHDFNSAEMLRTPHFYVLYLAMLMMGVGGLMVTANASAVGKSLGIGSAFITTALVAQRRREWSRTFLLGLGFRPSGPRKNHGHRVPAAIAVSGQRADHRKTLGAAVHHFPGAGVLHLGRSVLDLPVRDRRFLRREERELQLQLHVQHQGRRLHRRRRDRRAAL